MAEKLGPYLEYLRRSTVTWITGEEYGMLLGKYDIGVHIYKHPPGDVEEMADTVTHEVVHGVKGEAFDNNEGAVTAVASALMRHYLWQAAVYKAISKAMHLALHGLKSRKKNPLSVR